MNKLMAFVCLMAIAGCSNTHTPDVSGIPVHITIRRFDKLLFEKTDTSNIANGIAGLQSSFPSFTGDFITNILGLPALNSGMHDSAAALTFSELKRFIRLSRPLYDSLLPVFNTTAAHEKALTRAFQYVKYYFPGYKLPEVIAYLGPFDAPGVAITTDALAIGLQLYAGKNFSYYASEQGQQQFPLYISRRFEPQYITVNSMKAVTDDLFPDKSTGRPLLTQMIEKGKQWYLLNRFLPFEPDSLKTGYTMQQLDWCTKNEGLIWNYILQNNDLYTTEPAIVKNYIGEAPHTEGMTEASPGNIGQWIGWRIVEKYASKNPDLQPDAMMRTDAGKIFAASKYKPK